MNRSLQTACFLFATTLCALPLIGCKVTIEPLTRYEGTEVTQSVDYTSGVPVHIISANGQVDVVPGTSSQVQVTFFPFTMNEDTKKDAAIEEMERELQLSVGGSGEIVIQVVKGDGASSYLGADIHVELPSAFNGGFEVDQSNGGIDVDLSGLAPLSTDINSGNGSIDLSGARGTLAILTENGSISASVAEWSANDGSVASGNGSIDFTVPANADGSISAATQQGEILEQSIPATWTSAGESPAKSYTMGAGTGGNVTVTTDLGDITIIAR